MNKKVLILICVLLVCLSTLALVACKGGSYEMEEFIVDFSKLQSTYQQEDSVDLSKVKVTATFTDGSTEVIPLDKVKIYLDGTEISAEDALTKITETVGKKTLEFKYSTFVKSFEITVEEKHVPVLTGVKLDTADVATTSYTVGATGVSLEGLKVIAIYDQTIETPIALNAAGLKILMGEVIVTDLDQIAATVGDKVIKVRYDIFESTNSLIISVRDVYEDVTVTVPATVTRNYRVGDTVSLAGITATKNFRSGAAEAIPATQIKYYLGTAEVTDLSVLTATKGEKILTVKASADGKEGSAAIALNVANYVTGVSLSTTGVTLDYVKGDAVALDGVAVNVAYADSADNTALTLTSNGVACTYASGAAVNFANLTNTTGDKVITVTYAGQSDTFTVSVVEGETALAELSIESEPTVTEFTAGATGVTFEGLTIKATYKTEYSKDDEIISIEDFAANGVKLYFDDQELTSFDAVTNVLSEGESDLSVYVEYEGKQTFFSITVTNAVTGLRVDASAAKTEYLLDEAADFSGIVVTATLNNGSKTVAFGNLTFFDGADEVTDLDDLISAVAASKTVTVKYAGASADFTISVSDYVTEITVNKTTFIAEVNCTAGSVYDFADLVVTKVFKSGNTETVTDGVTFENHSITEPTDAAGKTAKVKWSDKEKNVTLIVNDVLLSIGVSNVPVLQYGSSVNFTTMTVTGTYRYGGNKVVSIVQQDGQSYMQGVSFALKQDDVFNELTQLELDTIAAHSGTHTVRLTVNGVSVTFDVVVEEPLPNITGYELASSFTTYNANRAYGAENQSNVTGKAFESAFFVSDQDAYLVGDDNPFKFLPALTQVNIETSTSTTLTTFKTDTSIFLGNVELTAVDNGDNTKTFKDGTTDYVTEYYTQNKYQFLPAALNKTFTLSVRPDSVAFSNVEPTDVVSWTVKVVDGYNVTDSRELCLLEQSTRTYWNGIKSDLGLSGLRPNAIILHQDTVITKDSLPSSMYYTLPDNYNIKYKYTDGEGEHSVRPEDVPEEFGGPYSRTFLWDAEWAIFRYDMTAGSSFTIHGNFFDIDMSKMPLVAAFEPTSGVGTIPEGKGTYYGAYMSKTSFLEVRGVEGNGSGSDETFNFSNFAVKGNAGVQMVTVDPSSNISQGADSPVLGGGLIFVKSRYCHSNITNIHAHACFIPFFSRNETVVNYTNVKAYDSFQNALFVHSDSVNYLTNCHMKRANGPLMILTQGEKDLGGGNKQPLIPQVIADDNSVLESYVTGQSQWFVTYGVTDNVALLAGMDPLLQGNFSKSMISDGSFDVLAVTVLDSAAGDITNQGYFSYKDCEIDRIYGHQSYETIKVLAGYGFGIFFVASDGTICTAMPSGGGYTLVNQSMSGLSASEKESFINSEYIVIIADGMGILTHFFAA